MEETFNIHQCIDVWRITGVFGRHVRDTCETCVTWYDWSLITVVWHGVWHRLESHRTNNSSQLSLLYLLKQFYHCSGNSTVMYLMYPREFRICNWKQLIIKSMWLINNYELMLAPSLSHHILILILRVNNSDVITHWALCLSFFDQLETGECTGPRPTATDKFTRFFMMIDVIIQTIKDL